MTQHLKPTNTDSFFSKTKPFLFIGLTGVSILMSIHTKFILSSNNKKLKSIIHKTSKLDLGL